MTEQEFSKLASLLNHLHVCMGLKFALMNQNAEEIYTSSAEAKFCSCIKSAEGGGKRCVECDRNALWEITPHDQYLRYRCHCGLIELAIPVVEKGEIIATILCGQFLDSSSRELQWRNTEGLLGWHGHPEELRDAFFALKQISSAQLFSLMEIIHACVSEVRLQGILSAPGAGESLHLQNYLDQHYSEALSIQSLCREMNMGKSCLFALCKTEFQKTPGQMILEVRMRVGKELLEMTNLTVSEIARTVGVGDAAYFSKCFRKTYGMVPMECRRRFMGEHTETDEPI